MRQCTDITTPTAFVLIGATGDLARKKLLAALFDLAQKGVLPTHFHVVAFSRDTLTSDDYRAFVREQLALRFAKVDEPLIERFLGMFDYVQGVFDDRAAFARIKAALEAYDGSIGMCTSKLFYLAVPPSFYDTIFEQIAHTKLDQSCVAGEGWTRILVEKPFGSDLDHAHYLEDKLSVLFREKQIYRIDHYLAKDALQNIIAFRFSNVLFEDKWNKDFVEAVSVRVFESIDVSRRGAFFDGVGALRDVGQNHMLQMLALIAMERPEELSAAALRMRRAEVLETLRPHAPGEFGTTIIKGQYAGYRETPNVNPQSNTETYFALKTFLDTPRWEGVPFYLEHGKAMHASATEIIVRFRSAESCVCGERRPHDHPNLVRFTIGPEQKITVRFWVHAPGLKYSLQPNDLAFDRHTTLPEGVVLTEAYEEVLFDALCGSQTLFVSSREQAAAWKYITDILEIWRDAEPVLYEKGGAGPQSAIIGEVQTLMHLEA